MELYLKILPVYLVMGLGIAGKRLGFFPETFVRPANRLIYYFAIPLLIFLKISRAPFRQAFQLKPILLVGVCLFLVWSATVLLSRVLLRNRPDPALRASFIQASTHGNLGYIGIAVLYFGLGDAGLAAGGCIMAVLVLYQNLFAIFTLRHFGAAAHPGDSLAKNLLLPLVTNPIILSLLLAVPFSIAGWSLPGFLARTMEMIAGMALPTALLIIGASLSFATCSRTLPLMVVCACLKLLVLPLVAVLLFRIAGVSSLTRTASTLLLAAPSATMVVILGGELGGDSGWGANIVSFTTLCSAITYGAWLAVLKP